MINDNKSHNTCKRHWCSSAQNAKHRPLPWTVHLKVCLKRREEIPILPDKVAVLSL